MATLNPRRFAGPDRLKTVAPQRLLAFLRPFGQYFEARGAPLPESADGLDYAQLGGVLMTPDEHVPVELVDALHFMHEMATADGMDSLLQTAADSGLELAPEPDAGPADVAVQVWLEDRDLLERTHAEGLVTRPRSFEYFAGRHGGPRSFPATSQSTIEALETGLDDWFDEHRRGRGSKVFVFDHGDKVWLLVRHGLPVKREGSLQDGRSGSVYYRPEAHDSLVYDCVLDELGVHAATKGERKLYLEKIGRHLFGDAEYFPRAEKYTLEPLRLDGPASLVCSDVDGLDWVRLVELVHYWGGAYKEVESRRATDLFAALAARNRSVPATARLSKAVFQVKFAGARQPRSLVVRPPNVALYTRDDDSAVIEAWLKRRGFVRQPRVQEAGDAEGAVVHA